MEKYVGGIVCLVLAASLIIGLTQPHFEAQSFNKLTGGNATYMDAFWSELRIDGSSQRHK